ncbi:MAG: T9SS type A sorting domain-containing protein [Bacteroidales bacterium]|nr:T9SS type A sorting domain-containing protein [Bacteroidales bacterium]
MKTKTTLLILTAALLISLFAAKTNAQIVYTDIDPDTTIYVPNVPYYVDAMNNFEFDINNDSIPDFRFIARNYSYESTYGIMLSLLKRNNNFVSGGCASGGYREDIFINDTIYNNLNWYWIKHIKTTPNIFDCELPVGDIYFGLMHVKNSDTLYGWVRCTATNNSITVKDYAYNTIPNMSILAGQTELGIGNFAQSTNINIYENSGYLNVSITYPYQTQGHIRIYNQQGALVKAVSINGQQNTIPLAGLAQGIYIVQVATQTEIVNKQIFLQEN